MSGPPTSMMRRPMGGFVALYLLSGILALIIPAIQYKAGLKRSNRYNYNNYNNNNQYESYDAGREWRDINNCKWYQFNCKSVWINGNGEYRNNQNENGQSYNVPNWFSGWSDGAMEGSRDGGNTSDSASLHFVHSWQIIIFLGLILGYSSFVLLMTSSRDSNPGLAILTNLKTLFVILFLWGNLSLFVLMLLANGSIYTAGRQMEQVGGFYNQFSVKMFLTNFWMFLWSIAACVAVALQICIYQSRLSRGAPSSSRSINTEIKTNYYEADAL